MALDFKSGMGTLEHLIHEGNVRKISIKQGDSTVAEVPLTIGVLGAVLAPQVAALGAIAALATGCRIEVNGPTNDHNYEAGEHIDDVV